MRRGLFSEKERELRKKIAKEHELFQYKMLASSAEAVYDACNRIWFYECIYEYFQFAGNIEKKSVDACLEEEDIMAALWELYVKYEYLKVGTWEDVEEILDVFVERKGEA